MFNRKVFLRIKKDIDYRESVRETLIISTRPVIRGSKQAIYAIHRGDLGTAKKKLAEAGQQLDALKKTADLPGIDRHQYNEAQEEYAEAACYYHFVAEDRLAGNEEIKIDSEAYLLGLCDLTGELARRAVYSVVSGKYDEAARIREFVESIYSEFLEFEFRNSELRKRADSIKWNLKKIEEILYDLKLRGKI